MSLNLETNYYITINNHMNKQDILDEVIKSCLELKDTISALEITLNKNK